MTEQRKQKKPTIRQLLALLSLACWTSNPPPAVSSPAPAPRVTALSYHEVSVGEPLIDRSGITLDMLVRQFDWLHGNGFHPVSIQALLDARDNGTPLPPKAVLLTFDDGYTSFHTHVLPLLKAYNYPAVLALVGSFMEPDADSMVMYGSLELPRSNFMSWDQVREAEASGLVEIASHSYGLHRGILANPQGNELPAAHVYRYDSLTKTYETEREFRGRVKVDLEKSAALLEREVGKRPRVMVWPYGAYGGVSLALAAATDMPVTLTLDPGESTLDELGAMRRHLVAYDWSIAAFAKIMRTESTPDPIRVVHVDLDYIWDLDPVIQERNLGKLLERIKEFHINTVYLQAYSDTNGDSVAEALYFPNRHLPMRADLFGRAAWQLRTRAGVKVFAWLPVMAFAETNDALLVRRPGATPGVLVVDPDKPRRLSPWVPAARQIIREIYADLSRYTKFGGLLFSDDAVLTDFEDAGPEALAAFGLTEGGAITVTAMHADAELMQRWTRYKTDALIALTDELKEVVAEHQGRIQTARNLFALPILEPHSKTWFAQDLPSLLPHYDQVAIMAMPYMEESSTPTVWLQTLLEAVKAQSDSLDKIVFEFQAVDWHTPTRPITTEELATTMRTFQRQGVINFGYYPDNIHHDQPRARLLHPAFSLQWFPFK
jgi:biofilm PGA synthesis lipoprotein PgaB